VLIIVLMAALVVAVEPLRWRATVVLRFMNGEITDVGFGELLSMLRPGSGFWLEPLLEGRSLAAVAGSPFGSKADVTAGGGMFRDRCGVCHGTDAGGASAPGLKQPAALKQGSSDWSMYRSIRDGIPGTAMAPVSVSRKEAWQIVSFLKSLQSSGPPVDSADSVKRDALAKFKGLSYQDLLEADRDGTEWRTYSRTYDGRRFSPLAQINRGNIGAMRVRWIRQLSTLEEKVEATPIVVDGVMFLTAPPNDVVALNAATGELLWTYRRELTGRLSLCCGKVNRGVAILNDKVYLGTLDAHLVALDAKTGKVAWDIEIAKPQDGYSITGTPLALKDTVVTGVAGGEFGIRGFLHAADAQTGEMRWRFYTIPGPGEKGHDSWSADSWKTGGGPTWITGSFDPQLNLLYWGIGNPSPVYEADLRAGDNLYTNSVVAIEATTGRLVWHFQFTPNDAHDWDANQVPVLTSIRRDGLELPGIAWANRNGFYYVLDRRDGRFIAGQAFVRQNWAEGLDKRGRPIAAPAARVSPGGTVTYPGVGGGTNWQSPAIHPQLGFFYVHAMEGSSIFTRSGKGEVKRRPFELFVGSGSRGQADVETFVRALRVETGDRVWEYQSSKVGRGWMSGLLATAGSLVLGGSGERAFALDAATGRELWTLRSGGQIYQGPITYSVNGQQVIVFIAGRAVVALSL
jgi:alcohol dehydrogenase (cytochrome c)